MARPSGLFVMVIFFGDQILSPPATPLVILGTDGQLIEKHIGITGAKDLAARLKEHLP